MRCGAGGRRRRQDLATAWPLRLLAKRERGRTKTVFGCVSKGCTNAQDWEKKTKSEKKKEKEKEKKNEKWTYRFVTPTKTLTSTGLACRVCAWLQCRRAERRARVAWQWRQRDGDGSGFVVA